jgi:Fe-S-cluster-containing hydrogenase component 2
VSVCPTEAISMVSGKARVDADECISCETCIDECSVSALSME